MPIRINLLAEEQAAEEMRRRDPVKRAIYIGGGLAGVMLFWIAITQMNVMAARRELSDYETRFKKVEDSSKQVRANQASLVDIQSKLKSLHRYSTNRPLMGNLLEALQQTTVDNIRLIDFRTEQRYEGGDGAKFHTTTIQADYSSPVPWWKPWATAKASLPLPMQATNALATITNKPPFTTNVLKYSIKITPTRTNEVQQQVTTQLEFNTTPWSRETTVVEIRGRDYGSSPGTAIDEFARRIQNSEFFKALLVPVEGFKFTERPPLSRTDPQDLENPEALFVPFTIELTFKNRIFSHE
ncbi:MAG TPA: hypothetical protein VF773_15200 [Verrucomicrobiae bacterium]